MSLNLDVWKLLAGLGIFLFGMHLIIDISSLLLVNRLFTQTCRMQVYSLKDLLLTQELTRSFDRALDAGESLDAETAEDRST